METWLQLGLGGASLYLLYTFVNKLFDYLDNKSKSDVNNKNSSMNKLVEKIDKMADSNFEMAKQMAENKAEQGKDIKSIFNTLGQCHSLMVSMNESITRIDVRTKSCLKSD